VHPGLICIGPQRCGTTWLFRQLARHPDIYASVEKEIHYFDHHHIEARKGFLDRRRENALETLSPLGCKSAKIGYWATSAISAFFPEVHTVRRRRETFFRAMQQPASWDDEWYRGLFSGAKSNQISIDFTASYCMLDESGIDHLLSINPVVRILMVIRNPIERAFSHYKMVKEKSADPGLRPDQFIRRVKRQNSLLSQQSDYEAMITRWERKVPTHQLKFLFYDELRAAPEGYLKEVCTFLSIPFKRQFFPHLSKQAYATQKSILPEQIYSELAEIYTPTVSFLKARFPEQHVLLDTWAQR